MNLKKEKEKGKDHLQYVNSTNLHKNYWSAFVVRIAKLLETPSGVEHNARNTIMKIHACKSFLRMFFSSYFQVTILEAGKIMWLGIGIVDEQYPTIKMPEWFEESVGYHTDDGNIFHNYPFEEGAKATKGIKLCQRDSTFSPNPLNFLGQLERKNE